MSIDHSVVQELYELGLTQAQIASQLRVSRAWISKCMKKRAVKTRFSLNREKSIERNGRKPTADELRALLEYDPLTGFLTWKAKRSNVEVGDIAGNRHSPTKGYECWSVGVMGTKYKAHRVIWCIVTGEWPDLPIDHKNGDGVDNRWVNLRKVTIAENGRNTRKSRVNTSGFKGVVAFNSGWRAQIKMNKKAYSLGIYVTPEEAHEVYCLAADMLFGEFANHGIDPPSVAVVGMSR